MGKFESLEGSKGNERTTIEALRMQIKENWEKNERESREIRESLNEMAIKVERQNRNLDKTFSFQENGNTVTRRDLEELERKIADKIEENFSRTNNVFSYNSLPPNSFKKDDAKLIETNRKELIETNRTATSARGESNADPLRDLSKQVSSFKYFLFPLHPSQFLL